MLLSAFRSVYNNAYVKGIASAVVLTAGLSAGQASAGNFSDGSVWPSAGESVTIGTGEDFDLLQIQGTGSNIAPSGGEIIITSGEAADDGNFIMSSGGTGAATVSGAGSITISATGANTAENTGLLVQSDATSGAATLDLNKITITKGTLSVQSAGADDIATVSADTFEIGQKGTAATADNAIIDLSGAGATLGKYTAAAEETPSTGSVFNLYGDAKIDISAAGDKTINAKVFNVQGATVLAGSGDTTIKTESGSFDSGLLLIKNDATVAFDLYDQNADVKGEYVFNGGKIAVVGDSAASTSGGELTISGGIVTINNGADFNAYITSTSAADSSKVPTVDVNGSDATLRLSLEKLNQFIGQQAETPAEVQLDPADDSTKYKETSGALSVTSGTLYITGEDTLDLGGAWNADAAKSEADIDLSATSATAGKIYMAGGTLEAKNILVDEAINSTNSNINLKAENFTLGAQSTEDSVTDFKFAKATVTGSLNVIAHNSGTNARTTTNTFELVGAVDEEQKNPGEASTTGRITGDALHLSGSIKVLAGDWEADSELTLENGATLKVGNDTNADLSYLKLNEPLVLSGSRNQVIVGGGPEDAVIDLTAGIDTTAASQDSFLFAYGNGTLLMDGAKVSAALAENNTANGYSIVLTGGTLELNNGLEATFADFDASKNAQSISAPGNDVISIANDKSSTILVYGTTALTTGSSQAAGTAGLDIGASTTLTTDTLSVKDVYVNKTPDPDVPQATVTIAQGTYNVHDALEIGNETLVLGDSTNTKNAVLNLYTTTVDGTGSINSSIELNGSGNGTQLNIGLGEWTSDGNVTVTSGTFTIGDRSVAGTYADGFSAEDGDLVKFNGERLTVTGAAANAIVNVSDDASASFTQIDIQDGSVNVSGTLTINGDSTGNVTSGANAGLFNGVNYESSTVSLTSTGEIVFGEKAVAGMMTTDGAGNVTVNGAFGKLTHTGGTVTLSFGKSESLSDAELNALKQALFSVTEGTVGEGTSATTYYSINNNTILNVGNAAIAGVNVVNGEATWDSLKAYADVHSDVTSDTLLTTTVTEFGSSDVLKGQYGSVETDADFNPASDEITVAGNYTSLNEAAQYGDRFLFGATPEGEAVNFQVSGGTTFALKNGGEAGGIDLETGATFETDGTGTITVDSVEKESSATGTEFNVYTDTVVTNDVNVDELNVKSSLTSGPSGDITVGNLVVDSSAVLSTNELNVNTAADISEKAQVTAASLNIGAAVTVFDIYGGASVTVTDSLDVADNGVTIYVGKDADETTDTPSSAGYLHVNNLDLNGSTLFVDPSYDTSASFASVKEFAGAVETVEGDGGLVHGTLIAGQNAVMGVGTESVDALRAAVSGYLNADGALDKDEIGSILYVASNIEEESASNNMKIVLDSGLTRTDYLAHAADYTGDVYLGDNTAIIVNETAFGENGTDTAVRFKNASKVVNALGGEVILRGTYNTRDTYNVFEDGDQGLSLAKEGQTITFRTENNLLTVTQTYADANEIGYGLSLDVNYDEARSILRGASTPVYSTLMAYASKDVNWADQSEGAEEVALYSGEYYSTEAWETMTAEQKTALTDDGFALRTAEDGTQFYAKYAENSFLDTVISTGNGSDAESVARLAVYGGAAEVALAASSVTSDAIASRMGMGNPNGNLVMADNEKGAGLWLAPVYKNHESDDFDAEGVNYGVDLDLTGVALGADYTFGSNVRGGAMFSVGSGDADGQGAGSAVSNDFDFWSVGVYGGYAYEAFSLTADLSWTQVDNDIDANTAAAGKVSASMDADVLSAGLTAKYDFDLDMVKVAPHLGMRYTSIDIDDYTVSDIASSDVDSISVFSIPAGVTFSTEIASASGWNVKPALDLTVTLNTGDDEVDSDVRFNGVDMTTDLTSEFIDDVTYGATVGVQVQKDAFQFGLGVNYTGSDNTDEFGVGASARFTF